MEHTFRNAMLRMAGGDLISGDYKGAEMWLGLTEPAGGQPWRWDGLGEGGNEIWKVEIEWRGDDLHYSAGDFGGGFTGIIKPDLTSVEDEDPNDPPFVAGPDYPVGEIVLGYKFEPARWSSDNVPMPPGTLFYNVDEFVCLCLPPNGTIVEVHTDQEGYDHIASTWAKVSEYDV